MTMLNTRLIATMFCAVLTACAAAPPSPETLYLPPSLFGVYEDNDIGALNQSTWAFADPRRTRDNPIDAARAVIAVDYLADELRTNPRWIGMSATSKVGMVRARADTRQVLGIVPSAPSRLVVEALLRVTAALYAGNQAAVMLSLKAPEFTLPSSQTLRILSNMPYIRSANVATLQASGEPLLSAR